MNPNDLFPQLKDIKPPVEGDPIPWMLIIFAVAVTLGSVPAVNFILRKKDSSAKTVSPKDEALAALDKIRLDDLHKPAETSAFYQQLSMILRKFIERRFDIHAPEMTTEEFLSSLQNHEKFNGKAKAVIEAFMRQCDLVKFARHAPDAAEARKNFEMVKDFIAGHK